jgi:predicted helicase
LAIKHNNHILICLYSPHYLIVNTNNTMNFNTYIDKINRQFQSGIAREHSYRAPFQNYLEALLPDVLVTNEPARSKVGAPDFILMDKKGIPIAYIETKDIGKSLTDKSYKEQFDRYKSGLDILIITDYLEFILYHRGNEKQRVTIAKVHGNQIVPYNDLFVGNTEGVRQFEYLIQGLVDRDGINITIKSAKDLAERMAKKARLFADVIFRALEEDDADFEIADGSLSKQFASFKHILINDISHQAFSDIYAQTITYGMFAARLHDPTLETFSRQEAAELIPKSNPFLRKLFQYVASNDLDERIKWMVDDLAEVFRHTDINAILKDFGKSTQQNDPIIHFYETFLAAYDPALRKARGVWYTPEPVVNFIVRAVDEVLKTEFDLKDGLADTSKVTVDVKTDNFNKRKQDYLTTTQELHRVQLLDPACGTGTFLAETIKFIHTRFKNQAGIWNGYVEEHLIPRLHGFELLMASYAMAHIKMDLLLRETGYTLKQQKRFKIFLTNSLEEHHKDAGTLFWAQWLADEARQADAVKKDAPVMVVLGNPPYSVSSSNNSVWIQKLMVDYKKELNERNIQPLSDDYIKFIRFGQHFIERNTEGVLAIITNNSFIDGLIHRQMRKSLLEAFDTIYVLDLHGNAKKKETQADGSSDQNVFDIMQGVSINIFIKTGKKKKGELAKVLHYDLTGDRKDKYQFLQDNKLATIDFKKVEAGIPQYWFVPKDFASVVDYEKGFKVDELFVNFNSGITTEFDSLALQDDKKGAVTLLENLKTKTEKEIQRIYSLDNDKIDKIAKSIADIRANDAVILKISYRPFDEKFTVYTGKANGLMGRPRKEIMKHMLKPNIALLVPRQTSNDFKHVFVSKLATDCNLTSTAKIFGSAPIFPLYLYPDEKTSDLFAPERVPNLKPEIVALITASIGKRFESERVKDAATFCPEDILDYIYAVLHTPQYREDFKAFLKIDFPRVPYPKDAAHFVAMVKEGKILRGLHLLEDIDDLITTYPNGGDNTVGKPKYENGKVWLNTTQYFDGVPEVAWTFYIGGYQPAQKWLKDRIGRKLSFEDVLHYQKIIVALTQTSEAMTRLDALY